MSKLALFDDVVAALQTAVFDPASWPKAFALIDEAVGIHGSTIIFGDGENAIDVRVFLWWFYYRGVRQLELEHSYLSNFYHVDERVPRVRRLPENELVHIKDLYTDSELKNSPAYNEAIADCHGQDSLHVRMNGPNDSRITWVPNAPSDDEGWSSAKLTMIRALLPHLRHAISAYHSLASAGILTTTLTDLLGATGLGVIQLDALGRILDLNDRGRSLLRDGDTLYDRQGILYARRPQNNLQLQKLLQRAIPSNGAIGYGGTTTFLRWPRPPILVQVYPLQVQEVATSTWPVAALVVIIDLPSRPNIDTKLVAETLSFTRMESHVAVMLAVGKSVPEIAAELGRKESTIRHHIKGMFAKQRLSRQAELIDLVRSIVQAPKTSI